jgi:hypothetical protein
MFFTRRCALSLVNCAGGPLKPDVGLSVEASGQTKHSPVLSHQTMLLKLAYIASGPTFFLHSNSRSHPEGECNAERIESSRNLSAKACFRQAWNPTISYAYIAVWN